MSDITADGGSQFKCELFTLPSKVRTPLCVENVVGANIRRGDRRSDNVLLAQVLARVIDEGRLTIIDEAGRSHHLAGTRPGPSVSLRVHDRWTGVRIALRPRLALGEAYMDGRLTVEEGDVYDLLDLLGRNIAAVEATPAVRAGPTRFSDGCARSNNTIQSARRRRMSLITMTCAVSSTTSSSIATVSIPVPISGPAPNRWRWRRPTRSDTSRPSCC